jgi:hypothetical protein
VFLLVPHEIKHCRLVLERQSCKSLVVQSFIASSFTVTAFLFDYYFSLKLPDITLL